MKVYCLLSDGYSDWEIGYVLPELRRNGVEIITVGFSFCSIKSMGGLTVQPDTTLDKASLDELDLFIIPGVDILPFLMEEGFLGLDRNRTSLSTG